MSDWLLLGGAVTLNSLGQWAFWRIVLVTPVTMVLIYVMVPSRVPKGRSKRRLLLLYGALWVVFLVAHLTILPRGISGLVGQMVKGMLEYVIFPLYYSKYRDWRTAFLMLTGGVFCLQANSVGGLLLGGLGLLPGMNMVVAVVTLLLLSYFCRYQRQDIWSLMESQDKGWWVFCSIPALLCGALMLFRIYPNPFSHQIQNPVEIGRAHV